MSITSFMWRLPFNDFNSSLRPRLYHRVRVFVCLSVFGKKHINSQIRCVWRDINMHTYDCPNLDSPRIRSLQLPPASGRWWFRFCWELHEFPFLTLFKWELYDLCPTFFYPAMSSRSDPPQLNSRNVKQPHWPV